MEEKRARTLEALSTFLQSQKALLSRTRDDIAKLREIRKEVVESTDESLEYAIQKLSDSSLMLSGEQRINYPITRKIEWSLLRFSDPAPFRDLASTSRRAHAQHNEPSSIQASELSELQKFVKTMRTSIIDPIQAEYSFLNELMSDMEEEPPDPEEIRRQIEREKIRELKKRRIDTEAAVPVFAGYRRPKASYGVFVRQDQEDESADVDISLDPDLEEQSVAGTSSEAARMSVDTPPTSVTSPASAVIPGLPSEGPAILAKATRDRRSTPKKQIAMEEEPDPTTGKRKRAQPKPKGKQAIADPSPAVENADEELPQEESKQKGKHKSETYKQAWSVSEQHLLERLLEEIPEGEKNRWSKISKAMNGRRTPRQVASRVQKYFEKLKRFGVEVGGNQSTAS